MEATKDLSVELTTMGAGKHHIGDFLPPQELEKFMEKYTAAKEGRSADITDYKENKLTETNLGFKMLQKMGWSEGEGLGTSREGVINPINHGAVNNSAAGLGNEKPDNVSAGDDEFDCYRKRMMLAYRFRPNPLNNPRRAYY